MQPPSVVIAANPYEAELCRRALVETGLRVVVAEGGEGALELLAHERPLVLVIALGLFGVEPLELVRQARAQSPSLPIFLLGDRGGDVADDEAAARLGASRLFLRPIDADALADAIEKRAVEAELADDPSEAMAEFSVRPPTIDAAPLVEEAIVELEADYDAGEAGGRPLARIALRRVPREGTEVLGAVERTRPRAAEGVARADDSGPIHLGTTPGVGDPGASPVEKRAAAGGTSVAAGGASAGGDGPRGANADEPRSPPPGEAELRPFEVTLPPDQPPPRMATEILRLNPDRPPNEPRRGEEPLAAPPPSVALPGGGTRPRLFAPERRDDSDSLLRADDALAEAAGLGLQALAVGPDFTGPRRGERPADSPRSDEDPRAGATPFDERSTMARRLERELSAAERRLFPDSPSTSASANDDDPYEDALGDIDLDRLGIDTIPGVGADALDPHAAPAPRPRNGHAHEERIDLPPRNEFDTRVPTLPRATPGPLPDDEGDLATHDIATLLSALHRAGFSGRIDLVRGDGEKVLFFDGGLPVFAASSLPHDRLVELLFRDGKISREQLARGRTVPDGGRAAAQKLVELGLIKSSELFATLRHHVEEILYSIFSWHTGRYRLSRELAAPEDRVRLGASPWALVLEGVRRKYGLERLVELVGPPDTVLSPTASLLRALDEGGLSPAERARAEAVDGERSLAELALVGGAPLGEAGLYALAWGLCAIGATRLGGDEKGVAASGLPTLITSPASDADRRTRPRPESRERDRDVDRAVDKERVLAKRAQIEEGDYFAVLGLPRDATSHEIARAFERLKREFAPDRFAESVRAELSDALGEIAEVLDEAQRVLTDERLRNTYRAHLPPP